MSALIEPPRRSLALDAFRGMTVCFMILANSPGRPGVAYGPLLHAPWHGFTATDAIFPTFLFVVGLAMAFATRDRDAEGDAAFWRRTLKRTGILFILGYLMYWFPFVDVTADGVLLKPLAETRILGVLQRIALCSLLASVVLRRRSTRAALGIGAATLLGYWLLLRLFGDQADPYGLRGNAVLRLDRWLLGEKHLYHGEGIAFDPEGLLSTLPATVNVIAGFCAGDLLRRQGSRDEAFARLMRAGVISVLVALLWGMAFPINKKLWTSSFALLTVGVDLLLLPLVIPLVEGAERRSWTRFFAVFGRNPLVLYLMSELLLTVLTLGRAGGLQPSLVGMLERLANPLNASLLFALLLMLTCWAAGHLLDRKGILVKV